MRSRLEEHGAAWIWPAEIGNSSNQYVEFRQEFDLDQFISKADLFISSDSNYAVWLNDSFVDCGQFSDFPLEKTYDTLAVGPWMKKGKNVLTISVFFLGKNTSTHIAGTPGLIYCLDLGSKVLTSGPGVTYRRTPGYQFGPIPVITQQLGLTFGFDARKNESWNVLQPENILPAPSERTLSPRPIKKLCIKDPNPVVIRSQGVFKRNSEENCSPARIMQTDFLSPRTALDMFVDAKQLTLPSEKGMAIKPEVFQADGVYVVLDLGREEAGFLDIDFDAQAGTIVDIGWGEHLDDLRVRTYVGERNFAVRYICKEGRQQFTHYFTRLAGRYLQLHITGATEKFILHFAGLKPVEYPAEVRSRFQSPDSLMNQIFPTSVRTLQLCMHEHYEDCPWREQALYANDGRNQALAGYYAFGEYAFPAASFNLLAKSLKDDGYMELCAPAVVPITIPSFTMVWFQAIGDYWLYSGDINFIQQMMPCIKKMMNVYLSEMKDGFLPCKAGTYYWHFYDWADGLVSWPFDKEPDGTRIDAPLNLFLCLALDISSNLAKICGHLDEAKTYQLAADRIRAQFHELFWNPNEKAYATYRGTTDPDHFAELTQALAIMAGAAPAPIASILKDRLIRENNGLVETTLSQSLYKFEALLTEKKKYGRWVYDRILRDWGFMLFNGATSFWETIKGGWDFDNAGSLCHGWSAIPVYLLLAYVLGIKPVEPGFREFTIDPIPDVVPCASGTVPTPFGPISLTWQKMGDKTAYTLSHPKEASFKILNLSEHDNVHVIPSK